MCLANSSIIKYLIKGTIEYLPYCFIDSIFMLTISTFASDLLKASIYNNCISTKLIAFYYYNYDIHSQQFRHRILGFEFRTHSILPNGSYYYGARNKADESLGSSLLITANFLVHKAYLEMFNMPEFINSGMTSYVNEQMNCEDLAMCTMVADFLAKVSYPQTSCVGMKAKHYPYNLEAQNSRFTLRAIMLSIIMCQIHL